MLDIQSQVRFAVQVGRRVFAVKPSELVPQDRVGRSEVSARLTWTFRP
jgi:hypothetical protein